MVPSPFPTPAVASWFERRTFRDPLPSNELADLKNARRHRVGVGIPALDEAETIGAICRSVGGLMAGPHSLVDRLAVVDSGSRDGTSDVARAAGAEVFDLGDLPEGSGKGGALHRTLEVLDDCDVVVWLDGDVANFDRGFVTGLLDPLLRESEILFVKGFYERPLRAGADLREGGARVTELLARPLLNLLCPELSGIVQPLAGECSFYRSALEGIRLFRGYGVDVGLLIDIFETHGLDAIAQADLGVRVHDNKDLPALGRLAHQVVQAMLMRFEEYGRMKLLDEPSTTLVQFDPEPYATDLQIALLPPISR